MKKSTALRKFVLVALVAMCSVALGLALAGCTQPQEGPGIDPTPAPSPEPEPVAFVPFEFTDSCGRTITISEPITRVAVSGPVAQQVLLGFAPDTLVGLATKMDAAQIKFLGDYSNLPVLGQLYGGKGDLNVEAVAATSPQILIDWGEAKATVKEDMDDLTAKLGFPCVHIEATMDVYPEAYTMLGKLLGMEDQAKGVADYCAKANADTNAGLKKVAAADRVSGVMLIGTTDGLGVLAKDSFQSWVFDLCCDNIAVMENPSAKGTGNAIDLEQVAVWAPQFILFAPGDLYEEAGTDAVWSTIPAVQNGNYIEIPGEPYNWLFGPPSVNQVLGMQWLSRTLYPGAFSDNAQQVVTEYYKLFYQYDLSDAEYKALTANSVFAPAKAA